MDLIKKYPDLVANLEHTCSTTEIGHVYQRKTCQCVPCKDSIFLIGKNKEVRQVNDSIIAAEKDTQSWTLKSTFLCGTPLKPVDADKMEILEKAESKKTLIFPIELIISKEKEYLYMHNTNCPGRFSKGTIITNCTYVAELDYIQGFNKSTGRLEIIKRRHLQLPKKTRQIHDSTLVQYTFPLIYMDVMTLHRVQEASLDGFIKLMIHQDL